MLSTILKVANAICFDIFANFMIFYNACIIIHSQNIIKYNLCELYWNSYYIFITQSKFGNI